MIIPPAIRSFKKHLVPEGGYLLFLLLWALPLFTCSQQIDDVVARHYQSKETYYNGKQVENRLLNITITADSVEWYDLASDALQRRPIVKRELWRGRYYIEWDPSPALLWLGRGDRIIFLYYPGSSYTYHIFRRLVSTKDGTVIDVTNIKR